MFNSLKVEIASVQNKLQEERTKYETAENENSQLKLEVTDIEIQLAQTVSNLRQTEMDAVRRYVLSCISI